MGMSLAKALTYRKRVAARIERVSQDIQSFNSMNVSQEREVDVKVLMSERHTLMCHMVDLKLAIARASDPVREHILMLSELKAKSSFLQSIGTQNGKFPPTFREDPEREYIAIYRKVDIDSKVDETEKEIDERQEALEKHNHMTEVAISPIV